MSRQTQNADRRFPCRGSAIAKAIHFSRQVAECSNADIRDPKKQDRNGKDPPAPTTRQARMSNKSSPKVVNRPSLVRPTQRAGPKVRPCYQMAQRPKKLHVNAKVLGCDNSRVEAESTPGAGTTQTLTSSRNSNGPCWPCFASSAVMVWLALSCCLMDQASLCRAPRLGATCGHCASPAAILATIGRTRPMGASSQPVHRRSQSPIYLCRYGFRSAVQVPLPYGGKVTAPFMVFGSINFPV